MLKSLPGPVRGALSLTGYTLNTIFWCSLLFLAALLKLAVPLSAWRRLCNRVLEYLVSSWVFFNNLNQQMLYNTRWEIEGNDALDPRGWYLVVANHQSWVDILVLQRVLYGRTPMLKFFLKKELIWVPILGLAWWALEFPFMKRYSQKFIRKHPHLAGKDMEITRKACRKFKHSPVSIMNFVEGTRFTGGKHRDQKSPHANLLRAKAGGVALVLGAMGDQIGTLLDVTIVYPKGLKSFWQFVCGNVEVVDVRIKTLPVGEELIGDYARDEEYRQRFQKWLNDLWTEKDRCIDAVLARSNRPFKASSLSRPSPAPGAEVGALRMSARDRDRKRIPPTAGF